MEVVEFGKENSRRIVLIPGNMMSWRQFEHLIPLLEKDYHVIAVSTDGFDGTGETVFTTAETSAEKLPLLLKLYTRTDDEKLLRQFAAVPPNISLETLKNCAREALRLYEEIDRCEPDPAAKVGIWYGAKEPNMKKAGQKLKRAFPGAELRPFPGFGHGEIIAHPERMAAEIRRFLEGGAA
jgi:pimeloyl-ACP methyl ester carboxylesterase